MKSIELLLIYFIYFQLNKAKANSTKLLQIQGLKEENIIYYGGKDSLYYKFTDNEIIQLTCSRKSINGRQMRLSWYKSGIKLDSTLGHELKQTFILKEADAEFSLECRLDEETSENDELSKKYHEWKVIILKYEKYLTSNNLFATGESHDATELVIDKTKLIFYSIGLLVILIAIAILIIILRMYRIRDKNKEDLQVKYERVEPALRMSKDYSHPKDNINQLYSETGCHYDLPTSQCSKHTSSESIDYINLINNSFYVNVEHQDEPQTDYKNVDNGKNYTPGPIYSNFHS